MNTIIRDEDVFGYFLNSKNKWSYTDQDFKNYNYYKRFKNEQKENEQQTNNMTYQTNQKVNKIKINTNVQSLHNVQNVHNVQSVQNTKRTHTIKDISMHQNIFIGIDANGCNHYSNLNENGSITYYYVDKSGLYYYYQ